MRKRTPLFWVLFVSVSILTVAAAINLLVSGTTIAATATMASPLILLIGMGIALFKGRAW